MGTEWLALLVAILSLQGVVLGWVLRLSNHVGSTNGFLKSVDARLEALERRLDNLEKRR